MVAEGYFSHLDIQLAQQYLLEQFILSPLLYSAALSQVKYLYLGLLWRLFLSIVYGSISVSAQHPLIELWLYN